MKGNTSNFTVFSNLLKSLSNLSNAHQINSHGNSNLLRIRLFSSFDGHSRNGQSRRNVRSDFNDGRGNYDDKFSSRNGRNVRSDFNDGRNNYDDKFQGRKGRNVRDDFNDDRNNYDDKFSGQKGRSVRDDFNDDRNNYDKFSGRNGRNVKSDFNRAPPRSDRQRDHFGGGNVGPDRDYRGHGRRNDGFNKPAGGDMGRVRDKDSMKLSDDFLECDEDGLKGENERKKGYQPSVRELLNKPVKDEKEDGEFLERFKLGGVGKEESRSDGVHTTPVSEEEKIEAVEDANEIFNQMKKSGLIPNAVAMLDGLCKDGLVHEAMKLFGLMREKGTMPEVVLYTAVVEGFCKADKLDDAKRIFKKMQDNGIVPNAFSYTVLIKGLCKGKRLDEAFDFCVEMLEAGHSPNVPTLVGLVHDFCNEKGSEDAQKVIGLLKQKGFLLDEKAVRVYLDKNGPTSPMVWETIFGPKKTTQGAV